jgi:hypothetical protein
MLSISIQACEADSEVQGLLAAHLVRPLQPVVSAALLLSRLGAAACNMLYMAVCLKSHWQESHSSLVFPQLL